MNMYYIHKNFQMPKLANLAEKEAIVVLLLMLTNAIFASIVWHIIAQMIQTF